eukprot:gene29625-biopygen4252
MYTKAQLDDAVAVAVADAVAAERVRTDAVQRAYKTLLAQTEEQHRLLNQALSLVSKQDEEIENLNLMLLVAEILGVKSEGADSDVFALMEGAMNVMGIHNLLPQSARRVDIAEVATELLSGDQILIRTAGTKERFHHGIFVGPISGVQGGKNLVVDCWGSQDAGKKEAKIRLRTLGEFMAVPGWPELAKDGSPCSRILIDGSKYCYNHVKQDDSFKEESNASEEPMTTTVEDYDALLRELENCRIKNQTLIKHNDELKLISETTMHENILLKRPIKLSDLAAQFGQTAAAGQNLKLSEYRRGGAYGVLAAVGANAAAPNVPSNNYNIKMSDFYGAYKIKTPVLNTIPTLTGTNTSANVTFSMESYLVSSSNYGTVTWTMTGNPTGVTINSSTAVITATAGTSVNNSITVTATGPGSIPVSKTFTMTLTTTRSIPSFPGVNNNAFVYAVIPGGQFNTEKLAVTFTKLYGMYFLNGVQQFTIEWTFTDRTNGFDSFFNKANTTNYGATYTLKVPKDPRAFGVISLTLDHPAGPSAAISGTELLKIAEQGDVRVQINSIGEECIWVCDETGSTIHAGSFVVDPVTGETRTGEPLETPIPVTEPAYEMRWMTTEIDAFSGVSITTLISKEDYEKRGIIQFGEGGSSTISFSNAPDTGLFNPVARTLGVVAGGTEMIEELQISSNTLYIGDTPVLCADNDAVSIRADPGQGITLTTTGDGETSLVSAKGVNVVSEGGVTMRVSGPLGRVNIQSSGAGGTVNLGAEKEIVMTAPLTTISSNMIVKGDLTVEGTQLTVNTQTVTIEDNIIVLNSGGSMAAYLEPWHADVWEFVELRRNTGSETERARDIFVALWVPDEFMLRVDNDSEWYLMSSDVCPDLIDAVGERFSELYNEHVRNKRYIRSMYNYHEFMSEHNHDVERLLLMLQGELAQPLLFTLHPGNYC